MSNKHKRRMETSESESDEESIDVEIKHPVNKNNGSDGKQESSDSSHRSPGPLTQHRKKLIKKIQLKTINFDNFVLPERTFDVATKIAFAQRIKKVNKFKTSSNKRAINKLDWSQIDMDREEAQECLKQILKPVSSVRTLDEMLDDYLANYHKYEMRSMISLPQNPKLRWIMANRIELEKKYKKKHPDEKIMLGKISEYGAKQWEKLPEDEKQQMRDQYKIELEQYHQHKEQLFIDHPELKKKRTKVSAQGTSVRKPAKGRPAKPKPEETSITPFKLFLNELKEANPEIRFQDAQTQYKNLGDREKLIYIKQLIDMDTDLEKKFTAEEKVVMKHSSGMPKKPLSTYNTFIRIQTKNASLGKGRSAMKEGAEMWKHATEEDKRKIQEIFEKEMHEWKLQMENWIKTLPADQRAEQYAKHKLFTISKKRKISEAEEMEVNIERSHVNNLIEIAKVDDARQKSPKKKKQNESESDATASPSKRSVVNASPTKKINSQSPSKKNASDENDTDWDSVFSAEKSPSKKGFDKKIAALGPYPSLSTVHYFMTQKMKGKSVGKVQKAFQALSKAEKRKLTNEMVTVRNSYLDQIKNLAKSLDPKYNKKMVELHKTNKEQQSQSTSWYKESDSEDSDDSDSDDS